MARFAISRGDQLVDLRPVKIALPRGGDKLDCTSMFLD